MPGQKQQDDSLDDNEENDKQGKGGSSSSGLSDDDFDAAYDKLDYEAAIVAAVIDALAQATRDFGTIDEAAAIQRAKAAAIQAANGQASLNLKLTNNEVETIAVDAANEFLKKEATSFELLKILSPLLVATETGQIENPELKKSKLTAANLLNETKVAAQGESYKNFQDRFESVVKAFPGLWGKKTVAQLLEDNALKPDELQRLVDKESKAIAIHARIFVSRPLKLYLRLHLDGFFCGETVGKHQRFIKEKFEKKPSEQSPDISYQASLGAMGIDLDEKVPSEKNQNRGVKEAPSEVLTDNASIYHRLQRLAKLIDFLKTNYTKKKWRSPNPHREQLINELVKQKEDLMQQNLELTNLERYAYLLGEFKNYYDQVKQAHIEGKDHKNSALTRFFKTHVTSSALVQTMEAGLCQLPESLMTKRGFFSGSNRKIHAVKDNQDLNDKLEGAKIAAEEFRGPTQ